MNKNLLAVAVALLVGAGVAAFLMRGSKEKIDADFAARLGTHLKELGLDPAKTAFEDDGVRVYCLTPPVEGGPPYVIEVFHSPDVVVCWARAHEGRGPVDGTHPPEVAHSALQISTGSDARTHRNCTEPVYTRLFSYFDGIQAAVKATVAGR